MSIRATLAAIFGAALAAVLLAAGAAYVSALQVEDAHGHSRSSAEALALHMQLMVDASRYMKEVYELYAEGPGHAPTLEESRARVDRGFSALDALYQSAPRDWVAEGDGPGEARRMRAHFAEITRGIDALRQAKPAGAAGMDEASRRELERISEEVYEEAFVGELMDSIGRERLDMREHFAEEERLTARARMVGLAAAAGSLALLFALVRLILGAVERGVQTLLEGAEQLASGALDRRVPDLGKHELGRLGAAFNRMAASLEEAQDSRIRAERMAALGQLAASVGHDLRNPLGAIRNAFYYVEKRVAGSDLRADPRLAQLLGVIDRELVASHRIIGNLLDFARERRATLVPCPLRPLVAEAISVVQPPRPARVENEVPEGLPHPRLDRDQFRQALVNLIQNATEALPEGREGLVRVTAEAAEEGILLRVIDNGDGIPEEQRERIFEPLFTTKRTGTGLGLAITAGVIKRHGAEIAVHSEPGAGTTFAIHLRQMARPGEAAARAEASVPASQRGDSAVGSPAGG